MPGRYYIEQGSESLIIRGLRKEADYSLVERVMRNLANRESRTLNYRRRFEDGIIEIPNKEASPEFRAMIELEVRSMVRRSIAAVVEEFEMGPFSDRLRLGRSLHDKSAIGVSVLLDHDGDMRYLENHEFILEASTGTLVFTGTGGKISGAVTVRYFTEIETIGDPVRVRAINDAHPPGDQAGGPTPDKQEISERFGRPLRRIMLEEK